MRRPSTSWAECVAQMADGAGQLAADLVGLPEDQLAEALVDVRGEVLSWLSNLMAEKHASVAADAFIRLVSSQLAELQAGGFHNGATMQ